MNRELLVLAGATAAALGVAASMVRAGQISPLEILAFFAVAEAATLLCAYWEVRRLRGQRGA